MALTHDMADTDAPMVSQADLRALMFDGTVVDAGDAHQAIRIALDTAREVRAAAKHSTRFRGAEVDISVADQLRAITTAAQRCTENLREMISMLGEQG